MAIDPKRSVFLRITINQDHVIIGIRQAEITELDFDGCVRRALYDPTTVEVA